MSNGGRADGMREYLQVLELEEGATVNEVRTAYKHLSEFYKHGSLAMQPIADEFGPEQRAEILTAIEDAYNWLMANMQDSRTAVREAKQLGLDAAKLSELQSGAVQEFTGPELKAMREKLGVDLTELEFVTRIGMEHLRNMEDENFARLPEEVFVRGYVISYAKCLSLDYAKVADDYMKRYRAWKAAKK